VFTSLISILNETVLHNIYNTILSLPAAALR